MLMRQPCPTLQFAYQAPFGATLQDTGVQFSVFSRSATAMRLLLYNRPGDREPAEVIDFDRDTDRWEAVAASPGSFVEGRVLIETVIATVQKPHKA